MEFKDRGKKGKKQGDTLYFNAYTEDLFHWDNDLKHDSDRILKINTESKFFNGFKELALEDKIFSICNDMQLSILRSTMKMGDCIQQGDSQPGTQAWQ